MKLTFLRPLLEAALALLLLLGALRWVTGLFSRKTPVYQLAAGRQLRLAFWPLLALGAGLSVVPAVALGPRAATGAEWGLAAAFAALTLALAGPALLLHGRYWLINQATTVVFQPEHNQLDIYEAGQLQFFARRDLARVERVTCRARRSFRGRYDFLRLHLHDGRSFTPHLTAGRLGAADGLSALGADGEEAGMVVLGMRKHIFSQLNRPQLARVTGGGLGLRAVAGWGCQTTAARRAWEYLSAHSGQRLAESAFATGAPGLFGR